MVHRLAARTMGCSALVVVASVLTLSGAGTTQQRITPPDRRTPLAPAAWRAAQATLERRENQWKSQKIDSYDIVVNRVGTWIQLAYEGSVRQGHLVEATRRFLFPLNAEKMPLPTPALATIEGLFADAHRFLEDRDYGAYTTVTYDVSYRVPRTIIYEPPEGVFDADRYITLERFQPIK